MTGQELFDILANPAFWIAVLRIATPLILGTLGVLLCELLTGARPYRLSDVPGTVGGEAVVRFATPSASQLRGDIDDILLKALHERPEQRYAKVEAMAADIVRHLQAASSWRLSCPGRWSSGA